MGAPPTHVLISGGGLAGLALAIGLARLNIRSTVYEIRKEAGTIGGALLLAPNALRVLDKTIGIYDQVRSVGFEFEHIEFYSDQGWRLGGVTTGSRQEWGYPALRVNRPALHQALLKCATEYKSLVNIEWNVSIKSVNETTSGVEVMLSNNILVYGDILVGADGIHSTTVRKHILGDKAPTPVYQGTFGIGAKVQPNLIDWGDMKLPAMVYSQCGPLLVFPVSPDGQEIAWAVQRPVPEKTREGWAAYEASGDPLRDARNHFEGSGKVNGGELIRNADPTKCIRSSMNYSDRLAMRIFVVGHPTRFLIFPPGTLLASWFLVMQLMLYHRMPARDPHRHLRTLAFCCASWAAKRRLPMATTLLFHTGSGRGRSGLSMLET